MLDWLVDPGGSNETNRDRDSEQQSNRIERLKNRYALNKLKPKLFKMKRNEMHTKINRKRSRARHISYRGTIRRNNGACMLYRRARSRQNGVLSTEKKNEKCVATMKRNEKLSQTHSYK